MFFKKTNRYSSTVSNLVWSFLYFAFVRIYQFFKKFHLDRRKYTLSQCFTYLYVHWMILVLFLKMVSVRIWIKTRICRSNAFVTYVILNNFSALQSERFNSIADYQYCNRKSFHQGWKWNVVKAIDIFKTPSEMSEMPSACRLRPCRIFSSSFHAVDSDSYFFN